MKWGEISPETVKIEGVGTKGNTELNTGSNNYNSFFYLLAFLNILSSQSA